MIKPVSSWSLGIEVFKGQMCSPPNANSERQRREKKKKRALGWRDKLGRGQRGRWYDVPMWDSQWMLEESGCSGICRGPCLALMYTWPSWPSEESVPCKDAGGQQTALESSTEKLPFVVVEMTQAALGTEKTMNSLCPDNEGGGVNSRILKLGFGPISLSSARG